MESMVFIAWVEAWLAVSDLPSSWIVSSVSDLPKGKPFRPPSLSKCFCFSHSWMLFIHTEVDVMLTHHWIWMISSQDFLKIAFPRFCNYCPLQCVPWLWLYVYGISLKVLAGTKTLFLKLIFVLFFVLESPDTEAAMDLGASEVMESEVLYDCVICGQSGPSTEDRPTGLVVLLQASSGTACPSILPFHSQMLKLIISICLTTVCWFWSII